jgi:hypothetical protein
MIPLKTPGKYFAHDVMEVETWKNCAAFAVAQVIEMIPNVLIAVEWAEEKKPATYATDRERWMKI